MLALRSAHLVSENQSDGDATMVTDMFDVSRPDLQQSFIARIDNRESLSTVYSICISFDRVILCPCFKLLESSCLSVDVKMYVWHVQQYLVVYMILIGS